MTQPQDEASRVRGYLIAQAGKLTLAELVEKVRKDTLPLQDAATAIPAPIPVSLAATDSAETLSSLCRACSR